MLTLPLLCMCLIARSIANPRIIELQPVGNDDILEQDQEKANYGQASHGFPDAFRGLDADEFRRMEAKVLQIKQILAEKYGGEAPDAGGSSLMGDIALNEEQADELLNHLLEEGRVKRKALMSESSRWSRNVPYVIDTDAFSSTYLSNIRKGISFWEDNTCLTFNEGVPTDGSKYMYIQAYYSGCWSYVGKQSGSGKQNINLGSSCASNTAVVIHEIGHALGFYHEQSRTDRDDYVEILLDKVISNYRGNFAMATNSDALGVAYDYGSVMHYGSNGFSTDGSANLIPKDPEYQKVLGQRVTGSFFDVVGMNYAYGCNVECGSLCQNGGIGDPNTSCGTCICPEGFGGDFCETSGPMSSGCRPSNGVITVSSTTERCLSTPEWPSLYDNSGHQCNWILKASQSSDRIEYYFTQSNFWMAYGGSDGRCFHWAEIKDSTNKTVRGKRYCGPTAPTFTKTSLTNTIVVHFSAEYPTNGYGFQLCYKLVSSESTTSEVPTSTAEPTEVPTSTAEPTATTSLLVTTTEEPTTTTSIPTTTTTPPSACQSNPCQNGGSCNDLKGGYFFECICRPHFKGYLCETRDLCVRANGKSRCVEENTDSCELNGSKAGFKCNCKLGFKGGLCQNSVCKNKCKSPKAERCEVNPDNGRYRCVCKQGWGGAQCTKNIINECDSNPCQNGATCKDQVNKFRCKCAPGFKGKFCQTPK